MYAYVFTSSLFCLVFSVLCIFYATFVVNKRIYYRRHNAVSR